MAIEGPLRELALSDVFQLLDLSRKTGALTIRTETGTRPALGPSEGGGGGGAGRGGVGDRLGHLLVRAGRVTERHIEAARRVQERTPGKPLGAILVEEGFVTAHDVQRQLRFQIQEAVFELMQWKDGYFRFEEGPPQAASGVSVRVPTESLLMEAARRIDEWSTLESKVPHMGVVAALVNEPSDDTVLDLHPSEWEVLAEIDGYRPLKAIAQSLGRSEFDIAKIAYGLASTGVIEIREEAVEERSGNASDRPLREALHEAQLVMADGHPELARRLLDDLARGHPERAEVHLALAEAQRHLGRWAEATVALGRAAALDPLSPVVHFELGFAAAHTGDFRRASDAWSTYLRLEDGDPRRRDRATRAQAATAQLLALLDEETP